MAFSAINIWKITDDLADADIIIVNTCTFIEKAKEESVNTILQAAEYKKTGKCRLLIVTGCLSQHYKEELLKEMPEIDALLGTGSWDRYGRPSKRRIRANEPASWTT